MSNASIPCLRQVLPIRHLLRILGHEAPLWMQAPTARRRLEDPGQVAGHFSFFNLWVLRIEAQFWSPRYIVYTCGSRSPRSNHMNKRRQ